MSHRQQSEAQHDRISNTRSCTSESWVERYTAAQSMLRAVDAVAYKPVYPHWIDDGRFWYERRSPSGVEYRIVEVKSGEGRTAFTKAAVAEALAAHLYAEVDQQVLMLHDLKIDADTRLASFNAYGESYVYDLADGKLASAIRKSDAGWSVSPDGRSAAFLRDHNLWIRDIATGAERPMTRDGTEHYAYADKPAPVSWGFRRCGLPYPPEGRWSPDSKRFFTLQLDERHVPDSASVEFAPRDGLRPKLFTVRTSLPSDPKVAEFRLISLEVDTARQTEARYSRLSAVRMNDTPFSAHLAWWSSDGLTAYFVDVERGEKIAHVVAFDVVTGATRVVFSESADSYVELSVNIYGPALIHPLPETDELIWYSERSGHGHLYLYDLKTGALKGAITSGPWQVRDVQHVDASLREVFFTAAGIASGEDPYTCKPCIGRLDGGPVKVLSQEPGDHIVWRPGEYGLLMAFGPKGDDPWTVSGVAPNGAYFVETIGAANRLPRTVLRDRSGNEIAVIEVADGTGLPSGWIWPEPVKFKAADNVTDIYGLLFKPWGYDPSRSYPVIDYMYGGPQLGYVPKSAFAGSGTDMQYLEAAHLSALGAFVLLIDGRGTANRERAFREASYGAIHTASNIEDHICGIRELARRHPAMDLERVGISGFSGGGYMTALAMLRFGEFFKVGVAGGGNYDQGLFWHCWGERYHGRFEPEHYATQAAKTYASGLSGKLLLIHGLMDFPAALFQLTQALIEQNKHFDLVLMPRVGHHWSSYGLRRRFDYFVTHLFGSTAPRDVSLTDYYDEIAMRVAANAVPPKRGASADAVSALEIVRGQ